MQLEVGVGEVDGEREPDPHRVADHAGELDRAQRKALVAAAGADREGVTGTVREERHGGVCRGGSVALAAERRLDDAHSGQAETALRELLGVAGARDDQHAAAAAHVERPEVVTQAAQVALERAHELRAIAPLERQLTELEQHAGLGHVKNVPPRRTAIYSSS